MIIMNSNTAKWQRGPLWVVLYVGIALPPIGTRHQFSPAFYSVSQGPNGFYI